METLGYYNGKVGTLDEMTVPFNDRVHFFGDGIYEAAPCRNYKIFALDEHLDRLFRSAAEVDIKIPHTKNELADILNGLVKKLDSPDQFVYWQVTRGTQPRNHTYPEDMVGNLWVVLKPSQKYDIKQKITCTVADDYRFLRCDIKTLNLLPSVLYSQNAEKGGFYECILHRSGRVTECAHSNVSIITNDGVFKTAPTDNLILPGIARKHLIKACIALGIKVDETPFDLDELMNASEIIVSSSSKFCLSVSEIDRTPVGGKAPELLEKLQNYVVNEFLTATEA